MTHDPDESTAVGPKDSSVPPDFVAAVVEEFDTDESTRVVSFSSIGRLARHEPKDRHLLVRVKGAGLGQVTRLPLEPCRIGRAPDAELFLSDDGVSRKHALLVPDGSTYVIVDAGSANGTFVGGQQIQRHTLRDGDVIQIGPSAAFRYTLTDAAQETLLRQLFEASVTDALTGASNREHLDTQLRSELSFARRHKTDVSLLLFDVDHFKKVNDTYGHPVGDEVLIRLSRAVASMVRNEDVFARYGGEEFAVIVRGIGTAGAKSLGERLRAAVEALEIPNERGPIRVTISLGCASVSELPDFTPEALLRAADARLYAAKRGGRNRVVNEGWPTLVG
jgi:diguanylate cyclase (GGDEF)-like protein